MTHLRPMARKGGYDSQLETGKGLTALRAECPYTLARVYKIN